MFEAEATFCGSRSKSQNIMSRPKTNICLNMIVKNEEKVLPRLFRSIKDYIDYYVIVDTGSTDGTIDLIKKEMAGYGIEGEVHERPWVNFGTNRQQALELAVAANRCEWLLFIDADEELGVSDPLFYEKMEPGVSYEIEKHNKDLRYALPHLINIRTCKYRWEGPVHNYLVTVEGPKRRTLRKDVWIIYHSGEGAKSHGVTREEKFLRDARILEKYLEENPGHTRSQFYLGQSYRDAGHLEKAYEEYKKRAAMEGWAEEKFMAQFEAGKILVRLGRGEGEVLGELLAAYNLRPTRAEPLFELARYFRKRKIYSMAALFAKAGVATRRPLNEKHFVNDSVYTWRLWDELAVATYWIGDFVCSKEACEKVLQRAAEGVKIPEQDLERVRTNLRNAENKLRPKSGPQSEP